MKTHKFKARIESGDGGGACVLLPYDIEKEFGAKSRVPVKATFDGVVYSGSLMPYDKLQHMLGVLKATRQRLGTPPGDTLEVEVWQDDDEPRRTLEVPGHFKALMKKEGVLPLFENLSYTHRKEYCRWITEAQKEQIRLTRLDNAITMLKQGVRAPG